jgi:hypothetical protein
MENKEKTPTEMSDEELLEKWETCILFSHFLQCFSVRDMRDQYWCEIEMEKRGKYLLDKADQWYAWAKADHEREEKEKKI